MILRVWHGWTTSENAPKFEALMKEEIIPKIADHSKISGYKAIKLLRRIDGNEIEFLTIMSFESIEAVQQFAGFDLETAVVPQKAQELLKHFEERARIFEVIADHSVSSTS
jgi:hypothetical protein